MITIEQIRMDLSIASGSLLGHIDGFPARLFPVRPERGGWSGEEIAEHLVLIDSLTLKIIQGPAHEADRPAGEKIPEIRNTFADRSRPLSARGPVIPQGALTGKEPLSAALRAIRNDLFESVAQHDMSEVCTAYTHGIFGQLTRTEWIYFVICHGDRHLHQLLQLQRELGSRTGLPGDGA